jgi:hypothetical protein
MLKIRQWYKNIKPVARSKDPQKAKFGVGANIALMVREARNKTGTPKTISCFFVNLYLSSVIAKYAHRKKTSSAIPIKKKLLDPMNGYNRPGNTAKGVINRAKRVKKDKALPAKVSFFIPQFYTKKLNEQSPGERALFSERALG